MIEVPSLQQQMVFHREKADHYGTLMYSNPKFSRFYGQPVPAGFEEEVKALKKLRDFHERQWKRIRNEVDP